MEKNLEKASFFAQYWGQKVFMTPYYSSNEIDDVQAYCLGNTRGYLLLKPLESITDEDAIELYKILLTNRDDLDKLHSIEVKRVGENILIKYKWENQSGEYMFSIESLLPIQYDFLRSKGYALPFRKLSVEQLIEKGYIRLAETISK